MPRTHTTNYLLPALALPALILTTAACQAGAWPRYVGPVYGHGRDVYAPSYYGYNLDAAPGGWYGTGYYGGGSYREYYSFGRGYGIANFPDSLPGPLYRGYIGHPCKKACPTEPWHIYTVPSGHEKCWQGDGVAQVIVEVPDGAEVWLEGVKMKQLGSTRHFVSPPLPPGAKYEYEIKAQWNENGRPVEQRQNVIVGAGNQASISFPTAPRSEELATPRPFPLREE
jgi:uncharacterized protein (TIGR03000 family)